jgi:imidazolonepropionase
MSHILIANAESVITCAGGALPRRGAGMRDIGAIARGYVLVDCDTGAILEVGGCDAQDWAHGAASDKCDGAVEIVDASGCCVMPGFVDPHTHPVYAGSRANEFYLRAQGKTYLEIAATGGGINASVRTTRDAPRGALIAVGARNAWEMLRCGTTTFEAKSGYGLSLESEIAMLEAIRELGALAPQEIVPTFLGAHAIPHEYAGRRSEYLDLVCGGMLDAVAARGLAEYVDVFIEEGAYTLTEGARVCAAARARGLGIRIHADEFTDKCAARLGVEMNAASVDHLGAISDDGVRALAGGDTIATLMPATIFFVGGDGYAPARRLIDEGAPVALASDLNPGSSMVYGLPLVMTLAVLKMRMTLEECIVASTINAAYSLGRAARKGSIEPGKDADIVIIDAPHPIELPYRMGADLVRDVIVRGRIVKRNHTMLVSPDFA